MCYVNNGRCVTNNVGWLGNLGDTKMSAVERAISPDDWQYTSRGQKQIVDRLEASEDKIAEMYDALMSVYSQLEGSEEEGEEFRYQTITSLEQLIDDVERIIAR
jgi:hypothetical protein